MKRFLFSFLFAAALTSSLHAQQPAGANAKAEENAEPKDMTAWMWANFLILAGGIAYLVVKNVPPYFRARSEDIQRGIAEASRLKAEAEGKMAEVEGRFATLGSEIEKLRTQLKSDMSLEGERIKHDTENMLARIHEQAEREISFLTKAARTELRSYSASLAIDMAKSRIEDRMNPQTQHQLVETFVHKLQPSSERAAQ